MLSDSVRFLRQGLHRGSSQIRISVWWRGAMMIKYVVEERTIAWFSIHDPIPEGESWKRGVLL